MQYVTKISLGRINNSLDSEEEKISELEYIAKENIQYKKWDNDWGQMCGGVISSSLCNKNWSHQKEGQKKIFEE